MLNPVFSVKHMRALTPIFYSVAYKVISERLYLQVSILRHVQVSDRIKAQVGDEVTTVDILSWLSRATLELVGQGGLGTSLAPLDGLALNEYGNALKVLV